MASVYKSKRGERAIRDWCTAQLASWTTAHETRTLDVLKASTHLLIAGEGSATVIFVPGTNACAAVSLPFLDALAKRFRVIAADVPGQPGLSSGRRIGRGAVSFWGRWLDAVVEQVRRDEGPDRRIIVVGHSLGGAIVLASRRSDVERVALSTAGLCKLAMTPSLLWAFLAWRWRPSETSSEALLAPMTPGWTPPPLWTEWFTLLGRHARTTTAPPPLKFPSGFKTALIISGCSDVFIRPRPLTRAAKKKLRVTPVFRDGGHMLIDEQPDAVADLIASRLG